MKKLEILNVISLRSQVPLMTNFLLPVLLLQIPNSPASRITRGVILGDTEYKHDKVSITPLRQWQN